MHMLASPLEPMWRKLHLLASQTQGDIFFNILETIQNKLSYRLKKYTHQTFQHYFKDKMFSLLRLAGRRVITMYIFRSFLMFFGVLYP